VKIIEWPDPILTKVCEPVTVFDNGTIEFAQQLMDTLILTKNAVGLSAPQVGESIRIIVMKVNRPYIMFNPEIVKESEIEIGKEGCLSFPGMFLDIQRSKKITVRFQDVFGRSQKLKFADLEARCILHEIDHLNGIVFTNRTISL